jgi:hypothetical protein
VTSRRPALRKAVNGGTVGKKNVRPAVIVVVEDNGAVARGFNDELRARVAAVDVESCKSHLACDVFEMNGWGFQSRPCFGRLRKRGGLREKALKKTQHGYRHTTEKRGTLHR